LPERVLVLGLRGESLLKRGDRDGGRAVLEEALALAPRHPGALLHLAQLDHQAGNLDAAVARYRRLIEVEPDNALALNNLAYILAVSQNKPDEADPLARRAVALVPEDGVALDTLAWIRHLLRDTRTAATLIADAVRLSPAQPEIRVHAAAIQAALGNRDAASRELQEAIRLDASMAQREDVRKLQQQLEIIPSR
jgi:tetratricopeptide (TPR) repeat protein